MKRALAMALGAMMVAGSAAPAAAASQIDFSGYYRAYFLNDVNVNKRNEGAAYTDSYFGHRLNIDMTFRPTDEIDVFWRLRAPSFARWGNGGSRLGNLETAFIYGLIKQDWGNVIVGKINDGLDTYGLASLGYQPGTAWTNVGPYDRAGNVDAIRYFNKWDNGFGIMGQYVKYGEGLAGPDATSADKNFGSDVDFDRYQLEATYEWDGGGAALGLRYDLNASGYARWVPVGDNDYLEPADPNFLLLTPAKDWRTSTIDRFQKADAFYVNPAIMHSWGGFSLHAEAMLGWSNYTFAPGQELMGPNGRIINVGGRDVDADGYSFYVDADYNYGPGNVNLAGWWVSGTDFGDDDFSDLVQIDEGNFYPLVVAFNATSSGWGNNSVNAVGWANNGYQNYIWAGETSFGLYGNTLTDSIDPDKLFANGFTNMFTPTGAVVSVGDFEDWAQEFYTSVGLNPLSDAPNQFGMLTNSVLSLGQRVNFNDGSANHWALALTGNHAFTDDISMNYGIGYLALNNPTYKAIDRAVFTVATGSPDTGGAAGTAVGTWDGYRYKNQEKDLGIELDLGFTFQLLDNLSFNTTFGYMFNGDAYKELKGYRNTLTRAATTPTVGGVDLGDRINTKAVWEDADDSYVWYNTLTFSF